MSSRPSARARVLLPVSAATPERSAAPSTAEKPRSKKRPRMDQAAARPGTALPAAPVRPHPRPAQLAGRHFTRRSLSRYSAALPWVFGSLELRAIRIGASSPINRRPARLGIVLGVLGFVLTIAQLVLFTVGTMLPYVGR